MVALVLIGVGQRKRRDGPVEGVALTHVPAQQGGTPRPGVGKGESSSAPGGIEIHLGETERLHADTDLDVPQLADEEMASDELALAPPEEHVTGWLHEPVAVHDALAVVWKDTRTGVRLEHRGTRLLHLEEEGVVLAGHEEHHPAVGPDAADPHHLDGGVPQLVAVQHGLIGWRESGTVRGEHVEQCLLDLTRRIGLRWKIVGS